MAFTVTARHAGNSGAVLTQTQVTDSTTPTASSLFLIFGAGLNKNHSTAQIWQTPVGGSLSYTQRAKSADVPWNGSSNFLLSEVLFSAPIGGSPSAFTVTMDAWATTATGLYDIRCLDITGYDTTTTFAQTVTGGTTLTGGDAHAGTVVLDRVPFPGNLIVVSFSSSADGSGGFTSPTAGGGKTFTQVHNVSNLCQGGVWYRIADGTEETTITCSDVGQTVGNYGAIAVELWADGANVAANSDALDRMGLNLAY